LRSRDNIVIYTEDVIGNPAEQKYILRWLLYFPIPTAVSSYNFDTDYICFYSNFIYNFYKVICDSCGTEDKLTNRLKKLIICRVFTFEPKMYKSIHNSRVINTNMHTNKKCFTLRKFFPPHTFKKFNNKPNILYTNEILNDHRNKIKRKINVLNNINTLLRNNKPFLKKKNIITNQNIIKNKIIQLIKNRPDTKSFDVIKDYLKTKFLDMGFENIEYQNSSQDFVNYFLQKDYFLSFDPFTFMNIIASLCGCISIVNKIPGLKFKEWINGDPFNKYGIAYGYEGVQYALKTQHLLLDHITTLFYENEDNVSKLITDVERNYNITINRSE
jgi:hypothetical protein